MKNDAPFEYVESGDPELFAKYVELRRRVYLKEYSWLPATFGYEDEMDRVSHIVIAVRDGAVLGGGRLTISTPECPRLLPLEDAGFSLKNCEFLKDLGLDRKPYGEISRMAVDPESSRGFEVSTGLGNALSARAAREGLDVVFSICPKKPARLNQINASRLGIGFHKYHELSTVFGVDMWLCAFTGLLRVHGHKGMETA
jgi:hypothetical protein